MGQLEKDSYPLDTRDAQYQAQTGNPKAYVLKSDKMPTITHEMGANDAVVGTDDGITVKPLRDSMANTNTNPDTNLHDQNVDVNAFEHSSGAFNSEEGNENEMGGSFQY